MFDYDVGLNEIVQILIKPVANVKISPRTSPRKKENGVADKGISDVSCMCAYTDDKIPCVVPGHSN